MFMVQKFYKPFSFRVSDRFFFQTGKISLDSNPVTLVIVLTIILVEISHILSKFLSSIRLHYQKLRWILGNNLFVHEDVFVWTSCMKNLLDLKLNSTSWIISIDQNRFHVKIWVATKNGFLRWKLKKFQIFGTVHCINVIQKAYERASKNI